MAHPFAGFVRHLRDRRSPGTIDTYLRTVESLASYLATDDLAARKWSRPETEAFLGRPRHDGARRAPSVRNRELAALRSYAQYGIDALGWEIDPTQGVPFLREPRRDPVVLTATELSRLFLAAGALRDRKRATLALVVVALLSQAGLRVHELVALDVRQVDLEGAELLDVRGKGGTVLSMPMNAPTVVLLRTWLDERARFASEAEPALRLSARKTRLSIRSAQHLLAALGSALGSAKRLSPHTLRHTAATVSLTMGADISTVSELLRHTRLEVTMRYLGLVSERRLEAVRKLGTTIPREVLEPRDAQRGGADARPGFTEQTPLNPAKNSLDAEDDFHEAA